MFAVATGPRSCGIHLSGSLPCLPCALAAVMDHAVYICAHSIRPHWQQMDVLAPIFIVFLLAMLLRQVRRVPRPLPLSSTPRSQGVTTERMTKARSEDTWSWPQIRDWISGGEHPITTEQDDLFGRAPVAAPHRKSYPGRPLCRPTRRVRDRQEQRPQSRPGRKWSKVQAPSSSANFDVWAVPRPEDVPRLALDQVVDALDHHVDTLGLRNLPTTYQRMVAALPVRNISTILGLQNQGDSLAELQRLTPLLEVLNARLVLIVEDVERTTPEFDTRHPAAASLGTSRPISRFRRSRMRPPTTVRLLTSLSSVTPSNSCGLWNTSMSERFW